MNTLDLIPRKSVKCKFKGCITKLNESNIDKRELFCFMHQMEVQRILSEVEFMPKKDSRYKEYKVYEKMIKAALRTRNRTVNRYISDRQRNAEKARKLIRTECRNVYKYSNKSGFYAQVTYMKKTYYLGWHHSKRDAMRAVARFKSERNIVNRGEECRKGHRRTRENTYTRPDGSRYCLECRNNWKEFSK